MDLHVLQICLTTWFITMLGFTSDPRTHPHFRTGVQVINLIGALFILRRVL